MATANKRLASLDLLRGFDLLLVDASTHSYDLAGNRE